MKIYSNKKHKIALILFIVAASIIASLIYISSHIERINADSFFKNDAIFNTSASINSDSQITKTETQKIKATYGTKDTRAFILDEYLKENDSPLYGHATTFVEACDFYNAPADCILLIAIAKNETDLCKYYTSADTFNCWGFGGPPGYRWIFKSFQESIYKVYDVLVNQYGIKYMIDPRLMESTFCGKGPECINWGNRILEISKNIDDYSEKFGYGKLSQYTQY